MKSLIKLFPFPFIFIYIFIGCSASSVVPDPQPTGNNTQDIYIQEWLTSPNLTFCERILDLENYLDGYFCMETMTKNKYYIPVKDWKAHNLDILFLHISKAQIRAKLDKDEILKDYLCDRSSSNVDCNALGTPDVMSEIQQWKEN